VSVGLYDENGQPKWVEHPTLRNRVDAIALYIGNDDGDISCFTIDDLKDQDTYRDDFELSPGQDVFILGFPFSDSPTANIPIWKRGTIASEPDFDIGGVPKIYVDTATRQGMSGSPVIAQISSIWTPKGKTGVGDAIIGIGRKFIGIYSGRIGADDEFKAQLGIVWKSSAVDEIINYANQEVDRS
jgi:hypothetical protein